MLMTLLLPQAKLPLLLLWLLPLGRMANKESKQHVLILRSHIMPFCQMLKASFGPVFRVLRIRRLVGVAVSDVGSLPATRPWFTSCLGL